MRDGMTQPKKVSASRSENLTDCGVVALWGLTKAQEAIDTKQVRHRTNLWLSRSGRVLLGVRRVSPERASLRAYRDSYSGLNPKL